MARPPGSASVDSRRRLFDAAAAEFAARGYAGANVERIARAARLNKAMIYYHFDSKAALYREILRDMFGAVRSEVGRVVASPLTADDKIRRYIEAIAGAAEARGGAGGAAPAPPGGDKKTRRYIEAIAGAAEARPHFPPIWLRELAEGGEHVDAATLDYVRDVLGALGQIVDEGRRGGIFH